MLVQRIISAPYTELAAQARECDQHRRSSINPTVTGPADAASASSMRALREALTNGGDGLLPRQDLIDPKSLETRLPNLDL